MKNFKQLFLLATILSLGLCSITNLQAQAGEVLDFDGTNDYINAGTDASLDVISTATWEGWFYFKSSASQTLFEKMTNYNQNGYYISLFSNKIYYQSGNGSSLATVISTSSLPLNTWTHVAVVKDGSTLTIYINGVEDIVGTLSFSSIISNPAPLEIGYQSNQSFSSGNPLNARMEEARIWNIARTEAEIQSTMNTELTGSEAGLVLYYQFNEGIAGADNTGVTNVPDLSGNGNDGSLINFQLAPGNTSNWVASDLPITTNTAVPTMGEWSLIIFGLLIASMGIISVMRWQRALQSQRTVV